MTKTTELIKKIIKQKNVGHRRLSMRTLAKRIEIPSGRLSELFSGKRRLTDYYLEKIFTALRLNDEEIAQIRHAHYQELYASSDSNQKKNNTLITKEHIEQLISWKLYAIMSFLETTTYQNLAKQKTTQPTQTDALGKSLQIPHSEVLSLIKLMESVQFIRWNETTKKWTTDLTNTTTGFDIPSPAIQNFHSEVLDLAKEKLPKVAVAKRDYSSMTMTIDPKELTRAKKMLRNFRQLFTKKMESGKKKEVYQLAIQFFPLTDSGDKNA